MKSQRRFAPKGDRNKPESVACLAGISIQDLFGLSFIAVSGNRKDTKDGRGGSVR